MNVSGISMDRCLYQYFLQETAPMHHFDAVKSKILVFWE